MKITKNFRGNEKVLVETAIAPHNIFSSGGNVVISSGFRGNKSTFEITISSIMLRKLRNACNKSLTDIDGLERSNYIKIGDTLHKEP